MQKELLIDLNRLPNVLMLGNGILRLNGGGDWSALLRDIQNPPPGDTNLDGIPYAMQPECLCGTDVEEVQRKTAFSIKTGKPHPILEQLLSLPFDAILTTNYTYEIEAALSGKDWSDDKERRKSFTALDGNPKVRHNTYICNLIRTKDGKDIPVFHLHGEKARKHSLILSYYSYSNSVFRLIELNRKRANTYQEYQSEGKQITCLSWLDYFLIGNVYAAGFGFDPSEFDVWWAIERKAREKAKHGRLNAYMIDNPAKHGVLKIETNINNTEDDDQAYKEYVLGKIPYEKFIDLYGIEADSLAEEDYEDFINDLIIECCENETSPFDVEYETFTERLSDYGGEMTLDEEAYETAREQAVGIGIMSEYAYREENDLSVTESFMFDAMTGQYIK